MTFINVQETQLGYHTIAPCFSQQDAEVIQAQGVLPAKVQNAPTLSHLTFMPSMHQINLH